MQGKKEKSTKNGIKKRKSEKKTTMTTGGHAIPSKKKLMVPSECLTPKFRLPEDILSQFDPKGKSFDELWALKPKEPGKVMIYGVEKEIPRWNISLMNDYTFSKMNHKAAEGDLPKVVKVLLDWVQETEYAKDGDGPFNQILINGYENGLEYIGKHSDDESQLKPNSSILSISLGETRKFRISVKGKKPKDTGVLDILLHHGDVIVMKGKMQKMFRHEIVKVNGIKGKQMGKRINLTFRKFK